MPWSWTARAWRRPCSGTGKSTNGHEYAIDAMLCATALQQPGRATIPTSYVEDVGMLTAGHSRLRTEKV